MTPGGIFAAYREKEVKTFVRADLDIDDGNLGLKGSPTRVAKSFTKELKGKGVVVDLGAEEAVDFLIESLKKKFVL
ncbi:MAG: hypothetical protein LBS86_01115 [Treponema sp.]|jgi:electron transfer flavoprotein beta subunit|nr:hypothetical protein [Treponema sp.]